VTDGVDAAKAQWTRAGLPFPHVPAALVDRFHRTGPTAFATDDDLPDPYQFDAHVARLTSPDAQPSALLAYAGHGLLSWAVHWYLKIGPLAVLVQSQWGDAAGEMKGEDALVGVMRRRFAAADALVDLASHAGLGGTRLVVMASDFRRSAWVVVTPGEEPVGRDAHDPFPEAIAWLREQQA
jgi:hypothetical protein